MHLHALRHQRFRQLLHMAGNPPNEARGYSHDSMITRTGYSVRRTRRGSYCSTTVPKSIDWVRLVTVRVRVAVRVPLVNTRR
jgi:hypothetical protein